MKILITGAAGFIGQNLVRKLIRSGHHILGLTRQTSLEIAEGEQFRQLHISDSTGLQKYADEIRQCETVIHLASKTTPAASFGQPLKDINENLVPTLDLLNILNKSRVKRFIFASSGGTVYGIPKSTPIDENHTTIPTTPYGVEKIAAENLIRLWASNNDVEYLLLRISNPYGPYQHGRNNQGVIGSWLRAILHSQPIDIYGDGEVVRDYLYIDDLVSAFIIAVEQTDFPSGIYNLGSSQGSSLNEIATSLMGIDGVELTINRLPRRKFDVPLNILNSSKFRNQTGWTPEHSLDQGLKKALDWLIHYNSLIS